MSSADFVNGLLGRLRLPGGRGWLAENDGTLQAACALSAAVEIAIAANVTNNHSLKMRIKLTFNIGFDTA